MSAPHYYSPNERERLASKIAFAHYQSINTGTAGRFAAAGIDPQRFYELDTATIGSTLGLRTKVLEAMRNPAVLAKAHQEVDFIEDHGIHPLWYTDEDYPALLKECNDVPAMLYLSGTPPTPKQHIISIVGTRHCTPYGIGFIEQLVADLASRIDGLLVVSGLAFGADIAAHRAALKAGIPTGAVMAEGLNRVYPAEHRSDAMRIIHDGGFLLSSYLSSDVTYRGNFLARNKLVAGMSEVTVIVESDIRGGAMSTARLAADYHREVLALPGRVTDQYSRGCNALISNLTARIVRDADDVIAATGWPATLKEGSQMPLMPELTHAQHSILRFLQQHPEATVNDIVVAMDRPYSEVSATMFELEMDGLVNAVAGGRYIPAIAISL